VIEESATVTQVGDGFAWVETQRQSACGACAARKGCGTATLAKVLGQRQRHVRAINCIGAHVGDRVVIGLAEGALLQGSVAVYLVPLLAMMLAAGLGEMLATNLGVQGTEAMAVALGLLGMAVGVLWVRAFARRVEGDERYQPTLIRRLD
jgi:sigma-E factor negative regulatory protein RseC